MSDIDHQKFEKKMVLRNIKHKDIDEIINLQHICFQNMEPWTREHLKSHLRIFPEGQFCVEYDGKIIGSCSSLIVEFDEYDNKHTFDEITDNGYITNHDPNGSNLYGIEVMVHPDFRRMKIGKRLYDARKKLARNLNLKSIVIGGRIPNYYKYASKMTPKEYVEEVIERNIYDPVLTFQSMNGFTLMRINANYMPDDLQSLKYATLMEWNNIDYLPDTKRYYRRSYPVRIAAVQYMLKKIDSFKEFAQQCEYFVNVSSNYGSDFVVFPEYFTSQLLSFIDERIPSKQVERLTEYTEDYIELFSELAVRYNVNIIGGSHFIKEETHIYNVSYLFHRNGSIDKQYKVHITPYEKKWWGIQSGDEIHVFDTDRGKIAIPICYDIEFPEFTRIATDKGAQILFVPFNTEDRQGYLRVRYSAQSRAIENQVYTVITGVAGHLTHVENMDIQYAQSAIFSPSDISFPKDGIVRDSDPNIETVIVADVDLEILRRNRINGTVTQLKDRREDLYEIQLKSDLD